MTWGCMASSGKGSLISTDDVTREGSSKLTSEVYGNIWSAKKDSTKLTWRSLGQEMEGFRLVIVNFCT